MKKANCGASMKPQQKNTPKMAKGGYASKTRMAKGGYADKSRMAMGGMLDAKKAQAPMGRAMARSKGPQSVQAMTAQSSAGARRQQRKYS